MSYIIIHLIKCNNLHTSMNNTAIILIKLYFFHWQRSNAETMLQSVVSVMLFIHDSKILRATIHMHSRLDT